MNPPYGLMEHNNNTMKLTSYGKNNHRHYLKNRKFLTNALMAVVLLSISLVVNFYSGIYASKQASNSVTDLILSNIRVFDVDFIFTYGSLVFWAFIAFLCFKDLNKLPFTFKAIALFVLIRSLFITLTHIGPFPTSLVIDSNIINKFSFTGDLFFSAHTGLPFLMALIFWENVYLRILFIISAVVFGVVVLLAHLHYSIDVLSAFFITYTIFHIAEIVFKKDKELFHKGLEVGEQII